MVKTIDMQEMRNLNLFEQITKISTHHCFRYNETIFFCVPKSLVMRAIGEKARNARKLSEIFGKKVRVIPIPRDEKDAEAFINTIISPLTIRDFTMTDTEIVVGGKEQGRK